jgi:hypothetical protein
VTGPENYREAERLIEEANRVGHEDPQRAAGMVASAQVHATLALAAATALNPTGEDFICEKHWPEYEAWAEVCSVAPPEAVSS